LTKYSIVLWAADTAVEYVDLQQTSGAPARRACAGRACFQGYPDFVRAIPPDRSNCKTFGANRQPGYPEKFGVLRRWRLVLAGNCRKSGFYGLFAAISPV
jgi:hypothetical protein